MEFSKYNVFVEGYPQENYLTIYNMFTHKIMCVTKNSEAWSTQLRDKMLGQGILVDDQIMQQEEVLRFYHKEAGNSNELIVMLILTRKCNCKCVYCYEEQQKAQFDDMIDISRIISSIIDLMKQMSVQNLKVIFYGGEPLLRKDIISRTSQTFHDLLRERYSFSIVTNGTQIEKEDFVLWKELGLKAIKVTLDGNEKSHNSRRPYQNGTGSYHDIVENLADIKDYTYIVLNIVLDYSVEGIQDLITDLRKKGIEPEVSLCVKEPNDYNSEEKATLVLRTAELLASMQVYQSTKIGFDHGIICMGKNTHTFGIDGKGVVYRCNGDFNSVIGTISSDIEKPFSQIKSKCAQCKYLPICFGGCLYKHRCEYNYFDKVVPGLVKIYTRRTV